MNPSSAYKVLLLISVFLTVHIFGKTHITEFHMIPMRDDTCLATDVYLPAIYPAPYPTVLIRSAYGRIPKKDSVYVNLATGLLGFAVVIQDTRGRGDSQGIDSLYFNDGWGKKQDGYDTVEWIARQSWSNGKIGMIGASALGMTSYFAAGAAPPHLTCCVVAVATGDLYTDALFYGGAYREKLVDDWMAANHTEHLLPYFEQNPFYSEKYERVELSTRYDSVNVPMLHIGGWFDIFNQGTLNAFMGVQESGGPAARGKQKLIMGPWTHDISLGTAGDLKFPDADALDYLDPLVSFLKEYLIDDSAAYAELPTVTYYLMGDADSTDGPGNKWISADTWPPETVTLPFYLHNDDYLSPDFPINGEVPDTFAYDPLDPVPSVGGQNLNMAAGSKDQSSLHSRDDILWYTTPVLEDTVTVIGNVTVTLYASSDALDTDFTAKLCDVYPDGRSMLIADGIVRARHRNTITGEELLTPGQIEQYTIDLWSTAIAFVPGHRIQLAISSSNSPRFEPNPNTGKPFRQDTTTQIANQIIYHNSDYPSALNLPVAGQYEWTNITGQKTHEPESLTLFPNYPNPFNGKTVISFSVMDPGGQLTVFSQTQIIIYNSLGQRVETLLNDDLDAGLHEVVWDGRDETGNQVASGIYICQINSGKVRLQRKMMLLR